MKKRIKGLLAMTMIFSMFFAAMPAAVSAETISVMDWSVGETKVLQPKDQIQGSQSSGGCFRVLDQDKKILAPVATVSEGTRIVPIYYGDPGWNAVPGEFCFKDGAYQVPDLEPGYKWQGTLTQNDDRKTDDGYPLNEIVLVKAGIHYTIHYDPNGGSGTISPQTVGYNDDDSLSDGSGFSRQGYKLKNWNTRADGKGTAYKLGEPKAKLTTTDQQTITLYAQWEKAGEAAAVKEPADKGTSGKDGSAKETAKAEGGSGSSPQTGDSWSLTGYLLAMAGSAVAMAALLFKRKRIRE